MDGSESNRTARVVTPDGGLKCSREYNSKETSLSRKRRNIRNGIRRAPRSNDGESMRAARVVNSDGGLKRSRE